MTPAELQSWLVKEGLRDELDELTRQTVISELDNLSSVSEGDKAEALPDWSRLLFAGSILVRSDEREHQDAALRIATAAMTLTSSNVIRDAASVLLSKLSNFRAIALAEDRRLLSAGVEERLGITLRIEAQHRQMSQSVLVESSGRWLPVNDFQQRFWSSAGNHSWVSASAPTASGKTFLVLQWLVDQMRSTDTNIAVYLAPTRALVSEIEGNLQKLFGGKLGIEVSSLPLRTTYDAARRSGAKLILVLTQERLHLLANALTDAFRVDLLIVDEAHKIGDNQRGVILQDAIERVCRNNSALKLVFISPATQNPEELLVDAPSGVQTAGCRKRCAHCSSEPHCCGAGATQAEALGIVSASPRCLTSSWGARTRKLASRLKKAACIHCCGCRGTGRDSGICKWCR